MYILNAFQMFMITITLMLGMTQFYYYLADQVQPKWVMAAIGPVNGLTVGAMLSVYLRTIGWL